MAAPLLALLHRIPHAVLAGLFFVMGLQALQANGLTAKLAFLAGDARLASPAHPLRRVRRRAAAAFVALELAAFAATFALTQTVAAVGFPVVVLLLVPLRAALLPRLFAEHELALLDAPAASEFTMESAGGGPVATRSASGRREKRPVRAAVVEEGAVVESAAGEVPLGRDGAFGSGEQTAMPSEAASVLVDGAENGRRSREDLERGEARARPSRDVGGSGGLRGSPALMGGTDSETQHRDEKFRETTKDQ